MKDAYANYVYADHGGRHVQERIGRTSEASPGFQSHSLRHRIYQVIETGHGEDLASKIFDSFIVTLILLNVAAFVAETVPSMRERWGSLFHWFELVSVAIFTIEYALRVWTA